MWETEYCHVGKAPPNLYFITKNKNMNCGEVPKKKKGSAPSKEVSGGALDLSSYCRRAEEMDFSLEGIGCRRN